MQETLEELLEGISNSICHKRMITLQHNKLIFTSINKMFRKNSLRSQSSSTNNQGWPEKIIKCVFTRENENNVFFSQPGAVFQNKSEARKDSKIQVWNNVGIKSRFL